jgi:hypothetical protein
MKLALSEGRSIDRRASAAKLRPGLFVFWTLDFVGLFLRTGWRPRRVRIARRGSPWRGRHLRQAQCESVGASRKVSCCPPHRSRSQEKNKMENREKDELERAPSTGDQLDAPGAMSHADIVQKNREFWGPEFAGHPGTEGSPVVASTRPSTVYQPPASNLPGPQSVSELKSRSAAWVGGNNKLRPSNLPEPGV